MGRRNQYVDADLTFAPKISETSKRIALAGGKRHSIESNGIPHFMLKTKCTLNSREPLGPIPVSDSSLLKEHRRNNPSNDTVSKSPVNTGVIAERNRPTTAVITLSLPAFGQNCTACTDEENANFVNNCNSFISNQMLVKRNNLFESDNSPEKNNSISSKNNNDPDLDSSVFTFKPCISTASIKIAETLNSDFMSRQQQHIENQKKHIERADIQFKKSLNLSPRSKRYPSRIYKDNENTNEVNNREEKGDKSASSSPPPKNEITSDDNNDNNNLEITESFDDIAEMPAASPLTVNRMKTSTSANLQRLLDGPYANEVLKNQKTRFSNPGVIPRPVPNGDNLIRDKENDAPGGFTQSRSKTMPSLTRPKVGRKLSQVAEGDRLRLAKETVEKAIKYRKIFTIQGGYASIRQSLRKRGWVEKFYKTTNTVKRQSRPKRRKQNSESDDDDDDGDNNDDNDDDDDDDDGTDDGTDDDNDEPKIPPWEEDDGLYGIMSRMVRNVNPQFFWVLKRDVIDYRFLLREQMVNHYCKAGSFTTKVGLCVNLRNVRLFDNADPDAFCPRCYRLSHEEDKEAFIDDYRLSACMNIVKLVHDLGNKSNTEIIESASSTDKCVSSVSNDTEKIYSSTVKETELNKDIENKSAKESSKESEESSTEEVKTSCKDPKCAEGTKDGTKCVHLKEDEAIKVQEEEKKLEELKKVTIISPRLSQKTIPAQSKNSPRTSKKKKKKAAVPLKALEQAICQCELFLRFKQHEDIDHLEEKDVLSDDQWDQQLQWYYSLAHDDGVIQSIPQAFLEKCENLMSRLRSKCPQFDLDGIRNVWIVKPGAKSRGRGIVCYDKLEDMLKLVNSQVVRKDSKYVVQKYIERPLLVYNTKFDIRQWFLVTDWNPLTIWFYQDSYLRFCSQQYTLDDFDESIHLSNNAIQKHYKNGPRSSSLPSDNMWTHEQFKDYLRSKKQDGLWEEMIYPGMKKAIQCALLTAQDLIEYRKSSFELYGADFMLTEDYRPWLIEINSSPSMEASTAVTARMCNSVLDDTIKVVIDRKHDRNCDIGRFELAFKQPLVSVPPYIGINLQVDGQAIKKPIGFKKSEIFVPGDTISPNNSNSNVAAEKSADSKSVSSNSNTRVNSENSNKKTVNSDNKAKKSPVQGATIKSNNSGTSSNKPAAKVPGTAPVDVSSGTADNKLQASISDTGINRSQYYNSSDLSATKVIKSGGSNRQPEPPSHPKVCMQTPFTSVGNRRIVSKTSVSVNYNIPGALSEKPTKATAVSVKNVESTDFTNVKSQSKGLTQLIPTMWCRMCSECGFGTNLHFHAVNPNCKCRRERMLDYFINSRPQSASPKPCNSQGTVGKSRPPSAASTIRNIKHKYSNAHTNPKMTKMDNILLRYTDTGSRRHSQISSVNKAPLPHVVGYFIHGTRPRKPIEKTTVYLDTSKYTNPFYIKTHKSNFQ